MRLRGVGATDLTDLVAMRESMFVVQVWRDGRREGRGEGRHGGRYRGEGGGEGL